MEASNSRKRGVPVFILIISIVIALFIGGALSFLVRPLIVFPGSGGTEKVDQDKLDSLKRQIDIYYKGEYSEKDLVEGAYKGYVEGLGDPYSTYLTKKEYQDMRQSMSGEYSGVGMTFQKDDNGNFVIIEVMEGSPAEKAGLEAEDIILSVDGREYDNADIMASHIRGEKGTKVKLRYIHDGKIEEAEIVRDNIKEQSVSSEMLDDRIGYISISSFIETTAEDFRNALQDMESQGARSIIMDLRYNGGGLVDQCVEVADEFMDAGPVVFAEDKNKKKETFEAKDGKTSLPLVVLVNGYSASASEILSYALKDNGVTIVGEKTYGKGVIQVTLPQSDGSALELTVMEYISPKGNHVHKKGIDPTVKVSDDPDTERDEQLEKAKSILKNED